VQRHAVQIRQHLFAVADVVLEVIDTLPVVGFFEFLKFEPVGVKGTHKVVVKTLGLGEIERPLAFQMLKTVFDTGTTHFWSSSHNLI